MAIKEKKKIKIFNVPWHLGHQYELFKIPDVEWSWLIQYKRNYGVKPRGDFAKDKVEWVTHYEPGKYDLALLHLDQQCIVKELWERGKGSVYRELNNIITDIPKIVIMHGTPYYPEQFPNSQEIIDFVKKVVGDNYMIVNSHRAREEWGWGKPIIHGLDPKEWWDLPKEPRVVTMISPGGLDKYYDRTFLSRVKDILWERDIAHVHITVDWQAGDWDDYRNFLGRSLLYFNPTRESPMPRSRTEAMLSGCCVLTTPSHDADTFIKDGINGFIIKRNPEYVVELIEYLMNHYQEAIKIGQAGKETAKQLFHIDRFVSDWQETIKEVLKI